VTTVSLKNSRKSFLSFDGNKYFASDSCHEVTDFDSIGLINIFRISDLIQEPIVFENEKLNVYLNSYREVNIKTDLFELYQLIDEELFEEISRQKLKIMFDYYERRKDSEVFKKAVSYYLKHGCEQYILLNEISKNKIFVDKSVNQNGFIKVKYNDTRTGRLSCEGQLNLFTINDSKRKLVISKTDYSLVKFDFIACQVRIFLYLIGSSLCQKEDPYDEVSKLINCSRDVAKECCIKIIFGSMKKTMLKIITEEQYKKLMTIFSKKIKFSSCDDFIFDIYDRPIKTNSRTDSVLNNNVLQCTERNIMLNSAISVNNFINEQKINGNILFTFHDALVIILHNDEQDRIKQIQEKFENSFFGCKMFSKVKKGNSFDEVA
jgi:hypothetical protein